MSEAPCDIIYLLWITLHTRDSCDQCTHHEKVEGCRLRVSCCKHCQRDVQVLITGQTSILPYLEVVRAAQVQCSKSLPDLYSVDACCLDLQVWLAALKHVEVEVKGFVLCSFDNEDGSFLLNVNAGGWRALDNKGTGQTGADVGRKIHWIHIKTCAEGGKPRTTAGTSRR